MNEQKPQRIIQATAFQRFTIRLVDGKFVRVPKADLPSTEPAKQTSANNLTEMRELFRLVNGRFTRLLKLETNTTDPNDSTIGMTLPLALKKKSPLTDGDVAITKEKK